MLIGNLEKKINDLAPHSNKYLNVEKLSKILEMKEEDIESIINAPIFIAYYNGAIPEEINSKTLISVADLINIFDKSRDIAVQKKLIRDVFIMNDPQFMQFYGKPRELFIEKSIVLKTE